MIRNSPKVPDVFVRSYQNELARYLRLCISHNYSSRLYYLFNFSAAYPETLAEELRGNLLGYGSPGNYKGEDIIRFPREYNKLIIEDINNHFMEFLSNATITPDEREKNMAETLARLLHFANFERLVYDGTVKKIFEQCLIQEKLRNNQTSGATAIGGKKVNADAYFDG